MQSKNPTRQSILLEDKLKGNLNEQLKREEILWCQNPDSNGLPPQTSTQNSST